MRPHLQLLAPAVFSVVRDMVIPVKLAGEQAFLALFQVVNGGDTLFEVCHKLISILFIIVIQKVMGKMENVFNNTYLSTCFLAHRPLPNLSRPVVFFLSCLSFPLAPDYRWCTLLFAPY
ncbi:hypothetical protein BDZ91DRAFT_116777 [Kalaharituber pfeilii]|nr:hypothetical protein BDZ91DRAFT_116777 [Kalaharituber pfeilii]